MRLARAPGGLSMTATVVLAAVAHGEVDTDFAKQSGLQVMLFADVSAGLTAPRISGTFAPQEALKRLLDSSDMMTLRRFLAPERADALDARAHRMQETGEIVRDL